MSDSPSKPWGLALAVALGWLILPPLIGFVVMAIIDDAGFMFIFVLGLLIGILGAIVHPMLILVRSNKQGSVASH